MPSDQRCPRNQSWVSVRSKRSRFSAGASRNSAKKPSWVASRQLLQACRGESAGLGLLHAHGLRTRQAVIAEQRTHHFSQRLRGVGSRRSARRRWRPGRPPAAASPMPPAARPITSRRVLAVSSRSCSVSERKALANCTSCCACAVGHTGLVAHDVAARPAGWGSPCSARQSAGACWASGP